MVRFRFKIHGIIFAGDERDAGAFIQGALMEAEPKNTVDDLKILYIEEIEEDGICKRNECI
jgi:hypothetical protein